MPPASRRHPAPAEPATRLDGEPADSPPLRPKEALLAVFRRLIARMARPAEQTRLLLSIAEEAARLARASAAALLTPLHDADDLLRVRVGTGTLAAHEGALVPLDGSFAGTALLRLTPLVTADLGSDARAYPRVEHRIDAGPACALPVSSPDSPAAGVILLTRARGCAPFEQTELDVLEFAAEAAAAALAGAARFHEARAGRADIDDWRRLRDAERWASAHETAAVAERRVLFRWDPAAGRWDWGHALQPVFGFEPAAFGDAFDDWIAHVHEQDRAAVRTALQTAQREGEPASVHCLLRHRAGASRRVLLRLLPPHPHAGPGRIGFLQDVTDLDRRATVPDDHGGSAAFAEFVERVRDELQNPLGAVFGQLRLLERDATIAAHPGLRDAVRSAHHQSTRIREILHRLPPLQTAAETPGPGPLPDVPPRPPHR